jgi:hypothetical protein
MDSLEPLDEKDDAQTDTAFGGMPSFVSYYLKEDGTPINANLLYGSFICQECNQLKADVVGYTLPNLIIVPQLIRLDHLIKCRKCMRYHIVSRLWLAILLAHIFSPFIVVFWLATFVQTFYRKAY